MASNSDRVFLTGATGFIGGHVARALLDAGYSVRALVRPGRNDANGSLDARLPEGLRGHVEVTGGDVLESGHLLDSLRECRYLIHTAALYSFSPSDRRLVSETNVRGSASILEAARLAGIDKVVVTSSSATVGPMRDDRPATEADWADFHTAGSGYHHSKIQQERDVLAAQVPTVLVLPTAPVGPQDRKPTPTGKVIVDFMRGRIFATLPGGLNLVPVEDVARAHVLALEHGRLNERYLVGGENLTLPALFGLLARICERAEPRFELPYSIAFGLGLADELRCRLSAKAKPVIPLEGVRMAREFMFVSSDKAESELGFHPSTVNLALERAVEWFRSNNYA